jgi:hypothetical protein
MCGVVRVTSNHPTGFDGFQSRMGQAVDCMGGDWLAMLAARNLFKAQLDRVQRDSSKAARTWIDATAREFDEAGAAALATAEMSPAGFGRVPAGPFTIVWTDTGVWRCTPRGSIKLAHRHGSMCQASKAGEALALRLDCDRGKRGQRGFRSPTRWCKDSAAAVALLEKWARERFV